MLNSLIVFVDHEAVVEAMLAAHPARLVNIQKNVSGELLVVIVTEEPLYSVQLESGEIFLISQGGSASPHLAELSFETPIVRAAESTLDTILEHHSTIISLLQYSKQLELSIESMFWHAYYQVEIRFHSIPVPVLVDLSHWQIDLTRAKAVFSLDQFESTDSTHYLDARFELPVLREQLEQERVSQ